MNESETFQFHAIGYVENDIREKSDSHKLKEINSRVVLDPDLVGGLDGLEPGNYILVVFVFHKTDDYEMHQHPRGDLSRPKRGVFTLRTPRRPNPIGITKVRLVDIDENVLTVHGLDAFHGTPVLDLKPA